MSQRIRRLVRRPAIAGLALAAASVAATGTAHAASLDLPQLPPLQGIELPQLPLPQGIDLPQLPLPQGFELPQLPPLQGIELPQLPLPQGFELPQLPPLQGIELPQLPAPFGGLVPMESIRARPILPSDPVGGVRPYLPSPL